MRPHYGSIQPHKISDRYDSTNPFKNDVTELVSKLLARYDASQTQLLYLDFFEMIESSLKNGEHNMSSSSSIYLARISTKSIRSILVIYYLGEKIKYLRTRVRAVIN